METPGIQYLRGHPIVEIAKLEDLPVGDPDVGLHDAIAGHDFAAANQEIEALHEKIVARCRRGRVPGPPKNAVTISDLMSMVSLSKALKLKNRKVQKVNSLRSKIHNSNSVLMGSDPDFRVADLYPELQKELADLWNLKAKINAANVPVHPLIYEMAEIKGQITWLNSLNTARGKQMTGYMQTEPQEYVAQMDAVQVAAEVDRLQVRLDEIQDELDRHNATVQIDID